MKQRPFPPCVVAAHCRIPHTAAGLRLAWQKSPSVSFVPIFPVRDTSLKIAGNNSAHKKADLRRLYLLAEIKITLQQVRQEQQLEQQRHQQLEQKQQQEQQQLLQEQQQEQACHKQPKSKPKQQRSEQNVSY